jgi:nucleoside permease NupC
MSFPWKKIPQAKNEKWKYKRKKKQRQQISKKEEARLQVSLGFHLVVVIGALICCFVCLLILL